MVKYSWIL